MESTGRVIKLRGGAGTSEIVVGHGLALAPRIGASAQCIVVTDENVASLYERMLAPFHVVRIPAGEGAKSLETVERLYAAFFEREFDRSATVIGFGGGVVNDIAAFAAATYLRGLRYGAVASTLLAQVDASIGGKNGVNYRGYKNLIGTIRQPEFCLCDTALLSTLPKPELYSGFAEVIKHAAIRNRALFEYLESNRERALALDAPTIDHIVYESVLVKAEIVRRDETEQGERRLLNFGHTIGHAIEAAHGIAHGEAVSIGMVLAARLSCRMGLLQERDAAQLTKLLEEYHLPTSIEFDPQAIFTGITRDKKRMGDAVKMVLLEELGRARVVEIPLSQLQEVLHVLR